MARIKSGRSTNKNHGALGFEARLWATDDKLRSNLDAAECKDVVLGLIFLKYISNAFGEEYAALQKKNGADPEARWPYIKGRARDPLIGELLDNAIVAIGEDAASRGCNTSSITSRCN